LSAGRKKALLGISGHWGVVFLRRGKNFFLGGKKGKGGGGGGTIILFWGVWGGGVLLWRDERKGRHFLFLKGRRKGEKATVLSRGACPESSVGGEGKEKEGGFSFWEKKKEKGKKVFCANLRQGGNSVWSLRSAGEARLWEGGGGSSLS